MADEEEAKEETTEDGAEEAPKKSKKGIFLGGGVLGLVATAYIMSMMAVPSEPEPVPFNGPFVIGLSQAAPDLRVNLEAVERLPFDDRAFDTVICCDVLEHLNNLHHMFGELVRVSGRKLVLSLPNCWTAARMRIERGHGEIGLYGLPADPPEDRHKWFFSLTQGQAFLRAMADRHGLKVLDLRATEKPRPGVVRALRRMRHPNIEHYLNRYAHTLWVAYERLDG